MRKSKSKRKAAPAKRQAAPLTIKLPANLVPPEGATAGCYIRSLAMLGKGTDEILELTHRHFKGTTAKGSDVSWNRAKLRAAGVKVPDAPTPKAKPVKKAKPKRKAKARRKAATSTPAAPAASEEPAP